MTSALGYVLGEKSGSSQPDKNKVTKAFCQFFFQKEADQVPQQRGK